MTSLARMVVGIVMACSACAEGVENRSSSSDRDDLLTLQAVTGDPQAYDGEAVRLETGYYGARETSVLTPGFAESYPPQPIEPMVWVGAAPPGDCLQEAQEVSWAERVIAAGVFQHDPDGGFGHLGAYDMALENAVLTCP